MTEQERLEGFEKMYQNVKKCTNLIKIILKKRNY